MDQGWFDYFGVETCEAGVREDGFADAFAVDVQGAAGLAGFGEFDDCVADTVALDCAQGARVEALCGDVFAEGSGGRGGNPSRLVLLCLPA
jgi:hypothetical protein